MKIFLVFFLMFPLGFVTNTWQIATQNTSEDQLTVYYFHNTRRCATCNAIESNTIKTLDTYFKDKMEQGTIQMITLNAEEEGNKEICEKYEIWGSTLLLVMIIDGNEKVENVTDFAFANARNNPEKFITGLKEDIENLLN
jgi:hypothetical protein